MLNCSLLVLVELIVQVHLGIICDVLLANLLIISVQLFVFNCILVYPTIHLLRLNLKLGVSFIRRVVNSNIVSLVWNILGTGVLRLVVSLILIKLRLRLVVRPMLLILRLVI